MGEWKSPLQKPGMRTFKPIAHGGQGPEAKIQSAIIGELKKHDWYVKVMIGNAFQFGIPDLFAAHVKWGTRWIEVKNPAAYSFTPAQCVEFPKLHAAGVGIWILFDHNYQELNKLYKPANWFEIWYAWSAGHPIKPVF